jgi:hypothetical protein
VANSMGRPLIEKLTDHRWWRFVRAIDDEDDSRSEVADPESATHRKLHWHYGRPSVVVPHLGKKLNIRTMIYLEYGDSRDELAQDMYGYSLTPGTEALIDDMREFGACGDPDCINPWHQALLPRFEWMRMVADKGREARRNDKRPARERVVDVGFGTRMTAGEAADTTYLGLCSADMLPLMDDGGAVRLPSYIADPTVKMLVGQMIGEGEDPREIATRAVSWKPPTGRSVDDCCENIIALTTARLKRMGVGLDGYRPEWMAVWQKNWQKKKPIGKRDGKVGGKLGDVESGVKKGYAVRVPPRPGTNPTGRRK